MLLGPTIYPMCLVVAIASILTNVIRRMVMDLHIDLVGLSLHVVPTYVCGKE